MRSFFTVDQIKLRGIRQNNLKGFDLDLPLRNLVVITGLSGSGKSSLAFETLFAEGQRRYIETFSPYARQFLDRMDKPHVDSIEGIPPAIAIEQRNTVKTTRSTVGTMTEICDFTKLFWPHLAHLYCSQCGQEVFKHNPGTIWSLLSKDWPETQVLVTFDLPVSKKFSIKDSLNLIAKQGYQRLLIGGEMIRVEESAERLKQAIKLTVIQDRFTLSTSNRARFVEACEQAFHFGQGALSIHQLSDSTNNSIRQTRRFLNRLQCATCDIEYQEPSSALFSFNHPLGACPDCRGFGRIINIDYDLAIPDRSKTLAGGAIRPWQSGVSAECQEDLVDFAKKRGVPMNVPFNELPQKWQDWVIEGDPGYGTDKEHQWPKAWYGVKGFFKWLESKAYKMHVRVLLSRYRTYKTCPKCHGTRFQPESLLYRIGKTHSTPGLTVADFYRLPISRALEFVDGLLSPRKNGPPSDPVTLALNETRSRLGYLVEAGLGYLSLDRPTRSLSGGETERVNLTGCLGSRLVNTLFVLDEPSVGLHARDTERLVKILERLRNAGNTVVVVEHEASVMRAADQIIDLGPGHGESGGRIVFQGTYDEILRSDSLTGQYLSGRKHMEPPPRRPVKTNTPSLILRHATENNLKDLSITIPLGHFVCITGVSGSGKTTLIREALLPKLESLLHQEHQTRQNRDTEEEDDQDNENGSESPVGNSPELEGWEHISRVVLVDQSPLGKTPRSNPAVYIGAFDAIRDLFAQSETARQRGLNSSAFSFNSTQGQCERCRGAGFEKIEMQFLSDVFIQCPDCQGKRYRSHILEITLGDGSGKSWNIADLLNATVDEVIQFLLFFEKSRPAQKAGESLALLQEVGLGYLRLGQPINTLSGGESQRLKLVSHLAEIRHINADSKEVAPSKPILFLFDEPTTGLHFDDVRVLLKVFQRLVNAGHSVLVIEHNLDVIRSADWIMDLGPEGGEDGGQLVIAGTPEQVIACSQSHTGRALAKNT